MPNEQTSVPLFSVGEVLTSADMNISAGTGVPVFTNTTTRDAAFGGAGEKVLAEGQLCYLSSTNVVQYYDGAAWATVGPSSAGGLVHISTTSISASTSTNIQSLFTSTYTNYRMVWQGAGSSAAEASIQMAITSTAATTNYSSQRQQSYSSTVATNAQTSQTKFDYSGASDIQSAGALEIYAPQLAKNTVFTGLSQNANSLISNFYSGYHATATAYDSVYLLWSAAWTGTVSFYGYAKA